MRSVAWSLAEHHGSGATDAIAYATPEHCLPLLGGASLACGVT